MTKHRPSWSDLLRRAAALACGLLLVNLPAPLWAAEKSAAKPLATKKKPPKKGAKPSARTPSSEIGTAEIVESELTGLHGSASFYGRDFHGRRTATGETFDARGFTAASNRFPLGTWVAVRRLDNDRCAVVKVNDRMAGHHRRRIIDVSRGVAEYLDMIRAGVVLVRVAPLKGKQRDDLSCATAFESRDASPDRTPAMDWRDMQPEPQLDAMH